MLSTLLPMKAVTGHLPASDEGWAYEIKWDGMRIVGYLNDDGRRLRLETTRGHDAAERFPELAGLPDALAPHVVVLDGEVVALQSGRPNFGRLQQRMHLASPVEAARRAGDNPVAYVIFDLLHLDGRDLTDLTYLQRRGLLMHLVDDHPAWRVPAHYLDDGAGLLEVARQQGLEGIVAKREDSIYLPGKRSPSWVKVKIRNRQEFVIGGWQPGAGGREGQLGSLLVGYYAAEGALCYAGRVVRASMPGRWISWVSFSPALLRRHLRSIRRHRRRLRGPPGGFGLTSSLMSPSASGRTKASFATPATSGSAAKRILKTSSASLDPARPSSRPPRTHVRVAWCLQDPRRGSLVS